MTYESGNKGEASPTRNRTCNIIPSSLSAKVLVAASTPNRPGPMRTRPNILLKITERSRKDGGEITSGAQ